MIWDKIKATFGRSLTIASGSLSVAAGFVLENVDALADVMGDPGLHDQIQGLIGQDPKVTAIYAKFFGVVMIVTRLRSKLMKPRQ